MERDSSSSSSSAQEFLILRSFFPRRPDERGRATLLSCSSCSMSLSHPHPQCRCRRPFCLHPRLPAADFSPSSCASLSLSVGTLTQRKLRSERCTHRCGDEDEGREGKASLPSLSLLSSRLDSSFLLIIVIHPSALRSAPLTHSFPCLALLPQLSLTHIQKGTDRHTFNEFPCQKWLQSSLPHRLPPSSSLLSQDPSLGGDGGGDRSRWLLRGGSEQRIPTRTSSHWDSSCRRPSLHRKPQPLVGRCSCSCRSGIQRRLLSSAAATSTGHLAGWRLQRHWQPSSCSTRAPATADWTGDGDAAGDAMHTGGDDGDGEREKSRQPGLRRRVRTRDPPSTESDR